MRDFKMDDMLKSNSNPNRLNVFYTIEALPHEPIVNRDIPKDFFNVSLTFRKDSTIYQPYDKFVKLKNKEKNNKKLTWSDKEVGFLYNLIQ